MKEFNFLLHLHDAITIGNLILAKHKTGDWLQSLTDDELEQLTITIEQDTLESNHTIAILVINLSALETGMFISPPLPELEEMVNVFTLIVHLERLHRNGYIKLQKALSLNDDDAQICFTPQGMAMADDML